MSSLVCGIIWLLSSALWGGTSWNMKDMDKAACILALGVSIVSLITSIAYFIEYFSM